MLARDARSIGAITQLAAPTKSFAEALDSKRIRTRAFRVKAKGEVPFEDRRIELLALIKYFSVNMCVNNPRGAPFEFSKESVPSIS